MATEILQRAHKARLAGVSVFRGLEGYGAPKPHPHQSDDPPMAVIIVDSDERIQPFLPQLDELITEGQVIVDDVEVVKYVGRRPT
jgi:uncharacterized protein